MRATPVWTSLVMGHKMSPGKRPLPLSIASVALFLLLILLLSGCVTPPPAPIPSGPTPEEIAKKQRLERANDNLNEGVKQYEAGVYETAMKSFLVALDSGVLPVPQQLIARKLMAFVNCVSSREAICREEFEKAFALDPKFDLSPAEAGHPIWGSVFRNVKADVEAKRSGRTAPPPVPKALSAGEKLLSDGMSAYDEADYVKSVKLFQDAMKETLTTENQIKARKFSAFSYCLSTRMTLCRQEFDKIFLLAPDFDLEPAEAGHPSWGPSFRSAKARAKAAAAAPQKKK